MDANVCTIADPNPEFLYRYRSLDGESLGHLERFLLEDEVFLASPGTFNDIFDCRINFLWQGSAEQWRRRYDWELRLTEPHLRWDERRRRVTQRMREGWHKKPDFWANVAADLQSDIDRLGVLCLTESPDDILMWSHYASAHTGVCLKFRRIDRGFIKRAQRVIYSEEYPSIEAFSESIGLDIALFVLTKARCWAYEREWRIVDRQSGPGIQKLPSSSLAGLILGPRIKEGHRELISKWIRDRPESIELLWARKNERRFALNLEPV